MFLPDESQTKEYLLSQLGNLCDADPEALTEYIIALLKHDKPIAELKAFCSSQLYDFMHEKTEPFITQLFQFIEGAKDERPNQNQPDEPMGEPIPAASRSNSDNCSNEDDDEDSYRRRRNKSGHYEPTHRRNERARSRSADRYPSRNQGSRYERRRGICHSFANRGFCNRGEECPFEHKLQDTRTRPNLSIPPVIMPPFSLPHEMLLPGQLPPPFGFLPPPTTNPQAFSGFESDARQMVGHASQSSRPTTNHYGQQRRRQYSGLATTRPTRSTTRLVLDKIPSEFCSICKINEYFSKFGSIVNVAVYSEQNRALIQFSAPEEAMSAFRSPDVIFNNRFVKLYWDVEDRKEPEFDTSLQKSGELSNGKISDYANHQATVKRQEALKSMLELQKQKQELLEKYIQQQKELLNQLESGNLADFDRQGIIASLKNIDALISTTQKTPLPSIEVTSIKESPSLDTALVTDSLSSATEPINKEASTSAATTTTGPILRGGANFYRGRGRGGRGLFNHPTSYRLDLRPTGLILNPIPAQVGKDIGSLRKFFEPYGEIKSISLVENGSAALVFYSRRMDAEKAMFYISKSELGEPFQLSWSQGPTLPSHPPPPNEMLTNSSVQPTAIDMGADLEFGGDDDERSWKR